MLIERDRTCERRVIALILLAGFAFRLIYWLATPWNLSPHDLGTFYFGPNHVGSAGHMGYIHYLYTYGQLPDFDPTTAGAMYNPPLHYILCALFHALINALPFFNRYSVKAMALLPFAYMALTTLVQSRILSMLSVRGRVRYALTALIAFFPMYVFLGAALTNDALALLLSTLGIYFTLSWQRTHRLSSMLALALSIGLGMATKLSVAAIAPATAFVFLAAWVRGKGERPKSLHSLCALPSSACR